MATSSTLLGGCPATAACAFTSVATTSMASLHRSAAQDSRTAGQHPFAGRHNQQYLHWMHSALAGPALTWRPRHPAARPPGGRRCGGRTEAGCGPAPGWHLQPASQPGVPSNAAMRDIADDTMHATHHDGSRIRRVEADGQLQQRLACDCQVPALAVAHRPRVRPCRLGAHLQQQAAAAEGEVNSPRHR